MIWKRTARSSLPGQPPTCLASAPMCPLGSPPSCLCFMPCVPPPLLLPLTPFTCPLLSPCASPSPVGASRPAGWCDEGNSQCSPVEPTGPYPLHPLLSPHLSLGAQPCRPEGRQERGEEATLQAQALPSNIQGGFYFPRFTYKETEAQRHEETTRPSCGLNPGLPASKAQGLSYLHFSKPDSWADGQPGLEPAALGGLSQEVLTKV